MKQTFRRLGAALAATALLAGLAACAPQSSSGAGSGSGPAASGDAGEPITIGLTYTPNIQFAAFYLAEEKGYFDEAGVSVELRHHGQSEELFGALESGEEDLVYAGGDEIVQARSAGVGVTSVAQLYRRYPAALIVPADSPIQTAADLKGRKVGTPGPYGQTYAALLAMLAGAGLSEQDVTVEHIGYTQQAALTGGKVDGVMGYSNNDAVQLEQSGFPVRVISAFPDGQERLVGPALGAGDALVTERPEEVAKIIGAVMRATEELIADPSAAIDVAGAHIPTLTTEEARANALATLEATVPLLGEPGAEPSHDPATWDAMVAFMGEQGLLAGEVPAAADCYTNELLP